MVRFSEGHAFYRSLGMVLMLAQFWLFVFALPPFHAGIWVQSEPVMVALFFTATLNGIWLTIGLTKGWLILQPIPPLFAGLLLWAGWQVLVTLVSTNGWRAWFGSGENGDGTGSYIALISQFLVVYPLWQQPASRKALVVAASASVAVQCLLQWYGSYGTQGLYLQGKWAPAQWGAYLAFMAAPLWLALVTGGFVKRRRDYGLLAGAMVVVLVVSQNKSAMALFIPAMLCSWLLCSGAPLPARLQRLFVPSYRWCVLAMALCALPLAWIAFSAFYPAFPSHGPGVFQEKDGPISSRLTFNKIGIAALQESPKRLLMGDGWGTFTDDLFRQVLVDGVYVYRDGKRQPNWFMVDGYTYHSHNQIMETLLSLGIAGMVLWFLVPVLALLFLSSRYFWGAAPMIVAQVVLSSLWFWLPQCLPYQALGWAALGTMPASQRPPRRTALVLPMVVIMAACMGWSTWQQWDALRYGEQLHEAITTKAYKNYDVAWVERDIARGGERLRASAMGYAKLLSAQSQLDDADRDWLGQYMQVTHDASLSPKVGVRVASTEVQLQYILLTALPFPSLAELGHQAVVALPDSIVRLAAKAPRRDDVATTFLLNLLAVTHGDVNRQVEILERILSVAPQHRGALWALGTILTAIPGQEAEGKILRDRTERLGVDRIYPVTDK